MVKPSQYRLVNYPSVTETRGMKTDPPVVATRRKRLRQWIDDHHQGNQAAFVARTGINQGELSLLLRDKSFGEKKAAKIEEASGMPPGYLSGEPISQVSEIESNGDYVRVRQLDAEAGMGSEIENLDNPEIIRAIDFESSYIRSIVGYLPPPGRLFLIAGRGDSMMPLIQPGDTVVVDAGVTTFDGDGVYLINMGNGHQIKRLLDRGVIHVASENPSYGAPFPMPDGTLIGGKVYLRNRIDRFN